jgi:Ni/Co efflux regulator RcnB
MNPPTLHTKIHPVNQPLFMSTLLVALALAAGGAFAAKPDGEHPGKGKPQKHTQRADIQVGAYFGDRQRSAASDYYGKQHASGRCPPGLAKKNNGCMPPGQAKKWQKGRPLASSTVWYPVPRELVVVLGTPPAGYRYVRVVNDILLIAIGTRMVVDAIEDLMR